MKNKILLTIGLILLFLGIFIFLVDIRMNTPVLRMDSNGLGLISILLGLMFFLIALSINYQKIPIIQGDLTQELIQTKDTRDIPLSKIIQFVHNKYGVMLDSETIIEHAHNCNCGEFNNNWFFSQKELINILTIMLSKDLAAGNHLMLSIIADIKSGGFKD